MKSQTGARCMVETQRAPQASSYSPCTVLAALCQRSLAFTDRYPKSLLPFCRHKRSSIDRVQIVYSHVRGYRREYPLSYSLLAHLSSTDLEQTEEPVEVDPDCMLAVLQNEVEKNYLVMYLHMKERRRRRR